MKPMVQLGAVGFVLALAVYPIHVEWENTHLPEPTQIKETLPTPQALKLISDSAVASDRTTARKRIIAPLLDTDAKRQLVGR